MRKHLAGLLILVGLLLPAGCGPTATPTEPSAAEPTPAAEKLVTLADVLFVRARLQPDGTWTFEVTVQHEDTGWEHCADRWEVLTPEGEVLAT